LGLGSGLEEGNWSVRENTVGAWGGAGGEKKKR